MSEDESKKIMKKLITVLSTLSETVMALEEKINQSNYQIEMLTRQVGKMEATVGHLDVDIDKEFAALEKKRPEQVVQGELEKMEKDVNGIPDDLLDEELKSLLEEEAATLKKQKEKK